MQRKGRKVVLEPAQGLITLTTSNAGGPNGESLELIRTLPIQERTNAADTRSIPAPRSSKLQGFLTTKRYSQNCLQNATGFINKIETRTVDIGYDFTSLFSTERRSRARTPSSRVGGKRLKRSSSEVRKRSPSHEPVSGRHAILPQDVFAKNIPESQPS